MVLFVGCSSSISWFIGHRIYEACVGDQCADAGFAWSASGSILLLVAFTILAGALLAKLWGKWGVLLLGLGLGTMIFTAAFCQ